MYLSNVKGILFYLFCWAAEFINHSDIHGIAPALLALCHFTQTEGPIQKKEKKKTQYYILSIIHEAISCQGEHFKWMCLLYEGQQSQQKISLYYRKVRVMI